MPQPAESAQISTVLVHPLVGMKMTTLRDQRTPPQQFRRTLHEIAVLMSFHVFAHPRCDARDVNTPLETTTGQYLQSPVPCPRSFYGQETGWLTRYQQSYQRRPLVIWACSVTRKRTNLSTTMKNCQRTSNSSRLSWLTRCWQPAALPSWLLIV